MRRSILLTIISAATFTFAACTPETKPVNTPPVATPASSPAASPATSPSTSPPSNNATAGKSDALVGKWLGAEGTFLNVTKKGDKFEVEIKNLDPASKKYEGTSKGDVIEFTRDGKTATIKTATGEETGMKWLLEKKNCVVITKGSEGFCKE